MVRFSGPCKTIPVRHSGGPPFRESGLGLGLTLADLRNGGPPEWGAGTCKTLNGAQRNFSKNYLKLANNSAVPFRKL